MRALELAAQRSRALGLGAAIATALLVAGEAGADDGQKCLPMADLRAALQSQFGEREVGEGLSNKGWLFRLFVTPNGSTWTVVGEAPGRGIGCVMDSGTDLHPPPPPGPREQGA